MRTLQGNSEARRYISVNPEVQQRGKSQLEIYEFHSFCVSLSY